MHILEILIVVWVNTYYGQSLVILEQVDTHRVGCVNWLDSEGLLHIGKVLQFQCSDFFLLEKSMCW